MRFLVIFICFSLGLKAQIIKPFVGLAANLDVSFVNNKFYNFAVGADFKTIYCIKPEIEIGYSFGLTNESTKLDANFIIESQSQSKLTAFNFSFIPKIIFYDENDEGVICFIYPKYTFTKATSTNEFVKLDVNGQIIGNLQQNSAVESIHAVGFGVGIQFNFKDGQGLAINIFYNNRELGNNINNLQQHGQKIRTKDLLGLGINYYFNL